MAIDPLSYAAVRIHLYKGGTPLGPATGFVIERLGRFFLATNFHVVSSRNSETGKPVDKRNALIADRLLMAFHSASDQPGSFSWIPHVQRVRSDDTENDPDGAPLWIGPASAPCTDVALLPLDLPSSAVPVPVPPADENERRMAIDVLSQVGIIGYPCGLGGGGLLPLWISGSVASEYSVTSGAGDFFLVDASTREGMSGSLVLARRFDRMYIDDGEQIRPEQRWFRDGEIFDLPLGVYSGRLTVGDSPNAEPLTIGRVWRWRCVERLLESYEAQNQRPEVACLGRSVSISDLPIAVDNSVLPQGPRPAEAIRWILKTFRFAGWIDIQAAAHLDAACAACATSGVLFLSLAESDTAQKTLEQTAATVSGLAEIISRVEMAQRAAAAK